MHGWANRILRIDLSDMRIWAHDAAPYIPDYLGARGIAARICWDQYPEPVGPFEPVNPLMIITGALTGSRSPYSGRTNVCAFSPQASPYHWFTRSSIGGHFGGELKRAGYDGIVVTGASDTPVHIRIRDDEVSVLPADDLWGLDIMDTLEALESSEGRGTRAFVIGPAGERLSRIATIQTASSSAAGQGGFGGVMGSKMLKAISVRGTGRVSLAYPDRITLLARAVTDEGKRAPVGFERGIAALNRQLAAEGGGSARCQSCTESCVTPCQVYFRDVPGVAYDRTWSGAWFCVANWFPGSNDSAPEYRRAIFDWQLEHNAAHEMNVLTNRYGLNQFDLLGGIIPWLAGCQRAGLISEFNGRPMDWRSPHFWAHVLHAIAHREGLGDALAEGGWFAAHSLHLGEDIARTRYPGWSQAAHWDGHTGWGDFPFPFWVTTALQWLSDTRDPFDSGHGYVWASAPVRNSLSSPDDTVRAAAIERARAVGRRVYGDGDAFDPFSGYRAKASPAHFHTIRPVIKDCVPVDDFVFPMITSNNTPDGFCVLRGVEGIGEIEGPSAEYHLFMAGTGLHWPEGELHRAAERICALERALQVRHWARDREMDETVLPFFERKETMANPLLGERYSLDREQFRPVLDEFYALHGWDPVSAWPTREAMNELGMADLYEPMVAGAARARDKQPGS
jgi:aldehyde:ferredoxin oxidoreductase